MNRESWNPYNRKKQREYRARDRKNRIISRGQCPRCGMRLLPEYEKNHKTCSWYLEVFLSIATGGVLGTGDSPKVALVGSIPTPPAYTRKSGD